jgi:gliding motility-associated lipoprotein GldH
MKKTLKIVFLFTLILSFSSCNKSQVYKEFKTLPNYTWERIEKGKSIEFDNINIENDEEVYDISFHIRHTPYITEDEIKFKLKITSPSSIVRESVHTVKLKDKEGKEWLGEAMGDIIDLEVDLKTFYSFIERGLYKIELVNMGQKYQLQGIMEVGIEINKSDLDR